MALLDCDRIITPTTTLLSCSTPTARAKQPYAIAMKDGSPFGIAGLWENWKEPTSGEWIRTFAGDHHRCKRDGGRIHDRMPAILAPEDYTRWLSDEPDPRALMRPFPAS